MQPEGMDVVPERFPRRREPINTVTGIFLKSVYFLNPKCSKCVIVGIFKERGNSLGVYFNSADKGGVYWSHEIFNQFAVHFNAVTTALELRGKQQFKLDGGEEEDIRVYLAFGKPCVALYDGEHTLSLTSNEWTQFINSIPLVNRTLRELFLSEIPIKDYIHEYLKLQEPPESVLLPVTSDRLTDELQLYRRWPNGGGS